MASEKKGITRREFGAAAFVAPFSCGLVPNRTAKRRTYVYVLQLKAAPRCPKCRVVVVACNAEDAWRKAEVLFVELFGGRKNLENACGGKFSRKMLEQTTSEELRRGMLISLEKGATGGHCT